MLTYSNHYSFHSTNYPLSRSLPLFHSYPVQLRWWFLLQLFSPTSKTFLPYFLPDIPKSGFIELFFSLKLFLKYQEHHLGESELWQTYHIQNQLVTYLSCFFPNRRFVSRCVCSYFKHFWMLSYSPTPPSLLGVVTNNSNIRRRLKELNGSFSTCHQLHKTTCFQIYPFRLLEGVMRWGILFLISKLLFYSHTLLSPISSSSTNLFNLSYQTKEKIHAKISPLTCDFSSFAFIY